LSLHGTPDGIHSTPELREHTVARRVGDTAPVARNQPVQDFAARGKGIEGRNLIDPHEAAIALNVSRKDSSQPALYFNRLRQG
jgi:hypothetical protein